MRVYTVVILWIAILIPMQEADLAEDLMVDGVTY